MQRDIEYERCQLNDDAFLKGYDLIFLIFASLAAGP